MQRTVKTSALYKSWPRQVAAQTAENISSMLQDMRRGAPTEIDAICGAVVRQAERLGLQAPHNRLLWHLVRAKAAKGGKINLKTEAL